LLTFAHACGRLPKYGSYVVASSDSYQPGAHISEKRIGLRDVRALGLGEVIWDRAVPGFGARRQRSAVVAYVLKYRTVDGRQRWLTIGRHGAPWTPDTAREEAWRALGEVVQGRDPAGVKRAKRNAASVAELCDLYIADAEAGRLLTRRKEGKKASTLKSDRSRIECHVKPLLGAMRVPVVTREDVEAFMHDVADGKTAGTKTKGKRGLATVRGGKGTASRTVGLLGAIFSYAVKHRMRSDNPVRGVMRFADGKRERRLSDDEYAMLGSALRKAEAASMWPAALAAARFLARTGWRSGEALGLRWSEIDLARRTATLADTKSGRSVRPLSRAACDVLRALTRSSDNALVFPAERGEGRMIAFSKPWAKIAKLGTLPSDLTPHVLRHSFASLAGDLGYSEPTIAALVGHKGHTITSRYVYSADAVLLAAADAVANQTAQLMGDAAPEGTIVPLRRGNVA
jgi:integrase